MGISLPFLSSNQLRPHLAHSFTNNFLDKAKTTVKQLHMIDQKNKMIIMPSTFFFFYFFFSCRLTGLLFFPLCSSSSRCDPRALSFSRSIRTWPQRRPRAGCVRASRPSSPRARSRAPAFFSTSLLNSRAFAPRRLRPLVRGPGGGLAAHTPVPEPAHAPPNLASSRGGIHLC